MKQPAASCPRVGWGQYKLYSYRNYWNCFRFVQTVPVSLGYLRTITLISLHKANKSTSLCLATFIRPTWDLLLWDWTEDVGFRSLCSKSSCLPIPSLALLLSMWGAPTGYRKHNEVQAAPWWGSKAFLTKRARCQEHSFHSRMTGTPTCAKTCRTISCTLLNIKEMTKADSRQAMKEARRKDQLTTLFKL